MQLLFADAYGWSPSEIDAMTIRESIDMADVICQRATNKKRR